MKYDLAWGHSVAVRQAFLATHGGSPFILSEEDLLDFNYPEHEGDKDIVAITKQIIRRQLGLDYKHVFITNGATGGVVITLRAYKKNGFNYCMTREGPNYVRYPGMIDAAGMGHVTPGWDGEWGKVYLLDLPSNPLGLVNNPFTPIDGPVVLDGVYYNNVYTNGYVKPISHEILVGSYSKLIGLNGVRVGWIATNEDSIYERLKELVTSEYCGLSMADSTLIKHVLANFNWDLFEKRAKDSLNRNREEWSKLERYFEGRPVTENGMFYYGKIDSACRALLEKSGLSWTSGSLMGTDDRHGRFSLGQDCSLTRKAVREVMKNDGLFR